MKDTEADGMATPVVVYSWPPGSEAGLFLPLADASSTEGKVGLSPLSAIAL